MYDCTGWNSVRIVCLLWPALAAATARPRLRSCAATIGRRGGSLEVHILRRRHRRVAAMMLRYRTCVSSPRK
jgi:hypothetical protein